MNLVNTLATAAAALAVPVGVALVVTGPAVSAPAAPAPVPAVAAPGEPSPSAASPPNAAPLAKAPVPTVAERTTGDPVQAAPASGSLAVDDGRDEPERAPRVLGTFSGRGRPPEGFEVAGAPVLADPGSSAGPVAGADDLSAGPWCNVQCITKGVAYEHGTGVEIVVETSVEAQILVTVVRDADGDDVPDLIGSADTPGLDTSLQFVLEDLEPGATYYGMATATDMYGNTSYAWGHFTMP